MLLMNEASGLIETYVFDWGNGQVGVALGLVSLLNHSREPNCEVYTVGTKKDAWLELHTTRAVEAGEELFIDYGLDHPTGAL